MDPKHDIPLAGIGDAIRAAARERSLLKRTGEVYVCWARRYVMASGCRHPADLGATDLRSFIHALADPGAARPLSAYSLRQALMALRFLYERVLHRPMGESVWDSLRAKAPRRCIPERPSDAHLRSLIAGLSGPPRLVALLQLGSGLRLREAVRVRIGDIDLRSGELRVGTRVVPLAQAALPELADHMRTRRSAGAGDEELLLTSARSRRSPLGERTVQRAYRRAGAGLTPQALRRSCELRLIENGVDPRRVQMVMGHRDIRTVLEHVLATRLGPGGVDSPLDDAVMRPTAVIKA